MHAVCKDCPRQRARPPGGRQALPAGHYATVSIVAHPFATQHAYCLALLQEPTGTRCLRPSRRACRPAQSSQICRTHCRSEQLALGQGLARSAPRSVPAPAGRAGEQKSSTRVMRGRMAAARPATRTSGTCLGRGARRSGGCPQICGAGKIPTLLPPPLNTAPPSSLLFPQAPLLGPAPGALAAAAPRGAPSLVDPAAGGGGCGWARARDMRSLLSARAIALDRAVLLLLVCVNLTVVRGAAQLCSADPTRLGRQGRGRRAGPRDCVCSRAAAGGARPRLDPCLQPALWTRVGTDSACPPSHPCSRSSPSSSFPGGRHGQQGGAVRRRMGPGQARAGWAVARPRIVDHPASVPPLRRRSETFFGAINGGLAAALLGTSLWRPAAYVHSR